MTEPDYIPNLLWVDLETTGLNEVYELPLEIAVVITDADLNVLNVWHHVLHQEIVLNNLSEWVINTHTHNGLLAEVVKSAYTVSDSDRTLASLMCRSDLWPCFTIGEERPPLCGSSINFERRWLEQWFPEFYEHIHYRSVDVSSIKELMQRWMPDEAVSRRATSTHRAYNDILDSIEELAHYRSVLWHQSSPV